MTYEWDDDDWKYDDIHPVQEEPDYGCWTCQDSGVVQGATREVNCPDCCPTPRQRRRQHLRDAWSIRQWHRQHERDLAASHVFDPFGAPF